MNTLLGGEATPWLKLSFSFETILILDFGNNSLAGFNVCVGSDFAFPAYVAEDLRHSVNFGSDCEGGSSPDCGIISCQQQKVLGC